jgi:hypothetical protein
MGMAFLMGWLECTVHVEEIESRFYEPVIKVTPSKVVKINSNPYN